MRERKEQDYSGGIKSTIFAIIKQNVQGYVTEYDHVTDTEVCDHLFQINNRYVIQK